MSTTAQVEKFQEVRNNLVNNPPRCRSCYPANEMTLANESEGGAGNWTLEFKCFPCGDVRRAIIRIDIYGGGVQIQW